jgi:hypothetical protein
MNPRFESRLTKRFPFGLVLYVAGAMKGKRNEGYETGKDH